MYPPYLPYYCFRRYQGHKRSISHGVWLDSGVMVGELTPAIDMQLSDRWIQAQKGTR